MHLTTVHTVAKDGREVSLISNSALHTTYLLSASCFFNTILSLDPHSFLLSNPINDVIDWRLLWVLFFMLFMFL